MPDTKPLFISGGPVLLLEADTSRAFRATARSVLGHLQEGQLGQRCRPEQLLETLGTLALEKLVLRTAEEPLWEEEALWERFAATPPAAIVAFDPLAGLVASRWAAGQPLRPLTIGVVSSLWLDPLWLRAPLDRVVVPDESFATALLEHGHAAESIVPVGLGVCGRFGAGVSEGRRSCRLTSGLPVDTPTLLLVTEGFYADEMLHYIEAVARAPRAGVRVTLLVDAAGDRLAREAAEGLVKRFNLPGRVFGRVDEAGILWGAADRVAGRALDQLVTRALTYRCPYWALQPADARQKGLVRALGRLGAGEALRSAEELADRLVADAAWHAPLDASRLETVASPAVLPRIAETLTQMIVEHEARH